MNTYIIQFTFSLRLNVIFIVCVLSGIISDVGSVSHSKHQVQLAPESIDARLGQLVPLKLPKMQSKATLTLTDPTGKIIPLTPGNNHGNNLLRKRHESHYKWGDDSERSPIFRYIGKRFLAMGPMTEDHDGNWVLTKFYNDSRGDNIEEYKFITIRIIEHTPPELSYELLTPGETFILRLRRPLALETCELIAPSTTFDRYYEREDLPTCTYKVPNVTTLDTGIWTLVAVGRIAYMAEVELDVVDEYL